MLPLCVVLCRFRQYAHLPKSYEQNRSFFLYACKPYFVGTAVSQRLTTKETEKSTFVIDMTTGVQVSLPVFVFTTLHKSLAMSLRYFQLF